MEKEKLLALNELQNFMTYSNVVKLKDQFIKEKLDPDESYHSIDSEKGEFEYYHSDKAEFVWIRFETELKKYLERLISSLKVDIDNSIYLYSSNERNRYFKNVFITFDYIKDHQSKLFKLFPICSFLFEEIKSYLSAKYNFHHSDKQNTNSYFGVKPFVKKSDIEKVYEFLIDNDYLNEDITSYDDFYSALNDLDTSKTIRFNCPTTIASKILNEVQRLFNDLTPKSIEESGRFITKRGTIITAQNLYAVKNRTKDKSSKDYVLIESFFQEKLSL
ncbi:DUF6617 family protein [Chryseobacterium jejuense]|uniref:DUF6617 family protein n=1 Tax=Chryseobacterium jejuense TaxID=445960 RepID=UPI001AE16273|nr:DUF6617 family protein [Chryseobacterium jejuense]MBP2619089.1 hypothetical protein [Chryseobacterium jejuense]